ncbi:MAG TPA: urea carboxylase, partial [Novosphingobium sp.]|nr:urea carboxylase [Novosphingobium sp.]
MTSSTADPYAAQAHARAMAGTVVEAMPVVPAAADKLLDQMGIAD